MHTTKIFQSASLILTVSLLLSNGSNHAQQAQRAKFYRGAPSNPKIQAMVDAVSAARIHATLDTLVGFETRHTNSDTVSSTRGMGAARRWIKSKFEQVRAATGSPLKPEFFFFNANICGRAGLHANVTATLPGTLPPAQDRLYVVSGHMDNRNVEQCDSEIFAPGANDDGSGTAAAIELARVMSQYQFEASLIFMTVTGEDEGLFGSIAYANFARANNLRIAGMLTNDVVGNIIGPDGRIDSTSVRHFSLGPSNSPSRQLARYFKLKGEQYVPSMTVNLIPAQDRPGRGGDHIPFNDNGYAAVRFTEPAERLEHQHSSTDIVANMSPSYTAQVTRLSLAGLASMALAPATPSAPLTVQDVGNGVALALSWAVSNTEPDFAGYRVAWRYADSLFYQSLEAVGNSTTHMLTGLTPSRAIYISYSALDSEGNESVFSTEVLATPQVLPQTPKVFAITSTPADIRLTWAQNNELDVVAYLLARRGPDATTLSFIVPSHFDSYVDDSAMPHILYRYDIKARDRDGNESPVSTALRGQLATHDRGILIIDGTKDGAARPLQPSDEQVDSFYENILRPFNLAAQWDAADSAQQQLSVSDADMGIYSTVIVHADVSPPARALTSDTLAWQKYLRNGGRLLLTGWGVIDNISGKAGLSKTFKPGEFVYDDLKIAGARIGSGSDRDFKGADASLANYASVTLDPVKAPLFNNNLLAMEILTAYASGAQAETMYRYRSSAQPPSSLHGQPVAFRQIGLAPKFIVIDFPLYFLPEAEAAATMRQALLDLGETATAVAEPRARETLPSEFALLQNYPNPVLAAQPRFATRIVYQLPERARVQIAIYNLAGQHVTTLVDELKPAGTHGALWEGKDEHGRSLASGVYLYKLETQNVVKMRKMVLMH